MGPGRWCPESRRSYNLVDAVARTTTQVLQCIEDSVESCVLFRVTMYWGNKWSKWWETVLGRCMATRGRRWRWSWTTPGCGTSDRRSCSGNGWARSCISASWTLLWTMWRCRKSLLPATFSCADEPSSMTLVDIRPRICLFHCPTIYCMRNSLYLPGMVGQYNNHVLPRLKLQRTSTLGTWRLQNLDNIHPFILQSLQFASWIQNLWSIVISTCPWLFWNRSEQGNNMDIRSLLQSTLARHELLQSTLAAMSTQITNQWLVIASFVYSSSSCDPISNIKTLGRPYWSSIGCNHWLPWKLPFHSSLWWVVIKHELFWPLVQFDMDSCIVGSSFSPFNWWLFQVLCRVQGHSHVNDLPVSELEVSCSEFVVSW